MSRKQAFWTVGALGAFVLALAAAAGAQEDYYPPAYASPRSAALGPWPFNFDIGGGPAAIAGPEHSQLTSGSVFTFGGGYNATPRTGFVVEFSDFYLGLQNSVIQSNGAVGGDATVWSMTLNPIWRYRIGGPVGGYIIGGGGFYEREIRLDVPTTVPFPGVYANRQYDDTGGVNIGTGLTWNLGWGTKFFTEVRYHYIFTSGGATQIIPVTFGLRW